MHVITISPRTGFEHMLVHAGGPRGCQRLAPIHNPNTLTNYQLPAKCLLRVLTVQAVYRSNVCILQARSVFAQILYAFY